MILELVLVMCLSECITVREQIEDCYSEKHEYVQKYGFDPRDPPYLKVAECTNPKKEW